MKHYKLLAMLLLCAVLTPSYAQKVRKQDPTQTKPFFILPYLDAFGMQAEELDKTPASEGSIHAFRTYRVRDYTFVDTKHSSSSIKYDVQGDGIHINHIFLHVYRIFDTEEETMGFLVDEIPADWEEIDIQTFKQKTGTTFGIHAPDAATYRNIAKAYRLPNVEGRPTIYAGLGVAVFPYKKKRYETIGRIDFQMERTDKQP